jgi:hypothetical protein
MLRDGTLLVDGEPNDAQLPKPAFLRSLRTAVEAAAAEELAGTDWTAEQCPWLDYWFAYFGTRSAHDVEATLRRYAPATAAATTATDYIAPVIERVRRAIQTWRAGGGIDAPDAAMPEPARVHAALGPGEPLSPSVRTHMEGALGVALGDVRIHADGIGARIAAEQAATAFTVGSHVAFAANEYRPGTLAGDALLAHELAHTEQQRESGSACDASLERHADHAAVGLLAHRWPGARAAVPAHGGFRLQRCKRVKDLPPVAKGKVPDYDSFADAAGNSALTDEQASAWAAMFQNPDQLDRVFADAASGNARAKQVVADLHTFFAATGENIAEIENRPDCMIPAWHELKGAVSDEGCMVDWSGLSYLREDRPGGEAVRTDIAKAYARRSRELGIRNSIIANSLTVFMVGWEMKAALAGEAKALDVRGNASGIPTSSASGDVDAVVKKSPDVTSGPKVIVDEPPPVAQEPAPPKLDPDATAAKPPAPPPKIVADAKRGYTGPWPPPHEGPRPAATATAEEMANWRYRRYARQSYEAGKTPSEILTPEGYEPHAKAASTPGARPGRRGGTKQRKVREGPAAEAGYVDTETTQLGTRIDPETGEEVANMVDGIKPEKNANGGRDYLEVDDINKNGLPRKEMRDKLKAEIPAMQPGDTLEYWDKTDSSRRIQYKYGDDPAIVDTKKATPVPRTSRK